MDIAKIDNAFYTIRNTLSQTKLAIRSGIKKKIKQNKIVNFYKNKKITCVSQGVADDMFEMGVCPSSCDVIYNPFNFQEIKDASEREINPYKNENYVVHVGRFDEGKRHDILLKAYAEAKIPQKLILLGQGEKESEIRNLVTELELSNKVIFAGFNANPYPILKDAKFMVLSSDFEGLPTVLIESLVLGVPVVSTDCKSGPSEIMTGSLKKYLSPIRNVKALADNIKCMSNHYQSIKIDQAIEKFSIEKVISRYLLLSK